MAIHKSCFWANIWLHCVLSSLEHNTCKICEAAVKPKNPPGPAGARRYYPVITAVDFGQTLAPLNLGWRFPFRIFWIEIDTYKPRMNRNSHDLRWTFLPRDAMHKRGLCCHAVSVHLFVCLPRLVSCVKTSKSIFENFSPSGSQAIIEAAVIGNKKLRCRYVEADYRQTRSIARPLCNSWASCFKEATWLDIWIHHRPFLSRLNISQLFLNNKNDLNQ